MTTAVRVAPALTGAAAPSSWRALVGNALLLLLVVLALPLAIIAIGAPVALVVRLLIALLS